MRIVLPGEKATSWNTMYSGRHWKYRQQEALRIHGLVRRALDGLETEMFSNPVDITVIAYFKNRPLDADNICSKFAVDGLKGWLIKDDTPEYVRKVTTQSVADKTLTEPRVEIVIEEASG